MNSRIFNRIMKYFLFVVITFFSLSSQASQKDSCDWIFIYYAPYDNDLSKQTDTILAQLSTASKYDNIRVVFQVDKDDTLGMYRYTISPEGVHLDTIPSEESTSRKQLTNYLDWINARFEFQHSAVFFMNHGGSLDEIGQDLQPDSTFLKTGDIRKSLKRFNKKNKQIIDLLYLQVCAKASIEPLYEFHDVTKYTLASQKLLGAPNYYYPALFYFTEMGNVGNGLDCAKTIAARDAPEMFESLTCIDNSKFGKVKSDFKLLIAELDKRGEVTFNRDPKHFDYSNDRYWDLLDFLDCLSVKTNEERVARINLENSLRALIVLKYNSHNSDDGFSGVSIAALSKDRIRAFWHMRFYRDFKFDRLPLN